MLPFVFVLSVGAFQATHCLPNLASLKIPEVAVLSPAELNNLGNDPQKRSINLKSASLNDVEATIKEVQDMIKADPSLPRLTRGEILDILENITKTDMERAQFQGTNNYRDPKAIMVVMPYTPSNPNDDKNIEDLYTKPPVTHIIGAEPFTKQQNSIPNRPKSRRRPPVTTKNTGFGENETTKHFEPTRNDFDKVPTQAHTVSITKAHRQRSTTTSKPSTTTESPSTTRKINKRVRYTTAAPEMTSESSSVSTTRRYHRRRPTVTTEKTETLATTYHPKTRRPLRRRPSSSTTSSTTTITRYPNHKYPDNSNENVDIDISKENYLPSNGIVLITPPQFALPSDINKDFYDLVTQENRRQEVYTEKEESEFLKQVPIPIYSSIPVKEATIQRREPFAEKLTSQATTIALPQSKVDSTTNSALSEEINIPQHLHTVVKDMKLDPSLIDVPENYFKKYEITTHSPSKEDQERIQSLLESLGIGPTKTTPPPTTTLVPDVSNIADTLTPEMRELLMSFGLIPNPNENVQKKEVVSYNPDKAEVDPASYVGFKPLPDDGESRDEMESLLASFGLGRSSRREKSLKLARSDDKINELNFDAVPDAYKDVIRDIGFEEKGRKIDSRSPTNSLDKGQRKSDNVNKNEEYATSEELEKLEKLMSIIKQLESLNRNVTEEDLKKIDMASLGELVGSLNNSSNVNEETIVPLNERPAPNPVNYDYSPLKNEVKRQELKVSGDVSIVTPTVVSSTTETAKTPSLVDLEASFGGEASTAKQVESTTTEAPTTTTKRTGFYYLVDWNTFLDIDDQKGKRVNLRLQPTIGDPKRFLSVSVP